MTKIAILDSQPKRRFLMCKLLSECEKYHFKVTVEGASYSSLKAKIDSDRPDIILMEIQESGLDPIIDFHSICPNTEMIVYSNECTYDIVKRAFEAGAVSFILKENYIDDLIPSISYTLQGGSFISPSATRSMMLNSGNKSEDLSLLSDRERLVVNEILDGLSYKLIGYKHGLSIDTVRQYIKRAYRKLQINSKGELLSKMK